MISNTEYSTSTRIRQEEQNQQHQQQNQQPGNDDYYNYQNHDNNNHARARACAREEYAPASIGPDGSMDTSGSLEQMRMIADVYRANICKTITPVVAHMIEDAMGSGIDVDTIIWAIEETGLAPNPSPRYLRAVLRNWSFRGHVSSRVHGTERHINAAPWYHMPRDEYSAASRANGEDPDDEIAWYL